MLTVIRWNETDRNCREIDFAADPLTSGFAPLVRQFRREEPITPEERRRALIATLRSLTGAIHSPSGPSSPIARSAPRRNVIHTCTEPAVAPLVVMGTRMVAPRVTRTL